MVSVLWVCDGNQLISLFFRYITYGGITSGIAQIAQFQFICFAFVAVSCYVIYIVLLIFILYIYT